MLSFKFMICSALIAISCGKEFILLSGKTGSSLSDVVFMDGLCAANDAEPASIESAAENAQAKTVCDTGAGAHCFFGLVRDDPTTVAWYNRDGADAIKFTNWAGNEGIAQSAGGEQCVVINGGATSQWHDYPCRVSGVDLLCQKTSGCASVDIDGFLVGCSDEFALTNSKVADNEGLISDNEDAIKANTDLINTKSTEIKANTDLINAKSTEISAEFEYVEQRLDSIAKFQAAHASPAVVDEFGNDASFFSSNNSFLVMSVLANVFLVLTSCYMVNKSRKGGYNKVKMYDESDVDMPLK